MVQSYVLTMTFHVHEQPSSGVLHTHLKYSKKCIYYFNHLQLFTFRYAKLCDNNGHSKLEIVIWTSTIYIECTKLDLDGSQ
jgi:hypothetical protein